MKIGFSDILALAKQGYTPNDIKELMNLEINDGMQTQEGNTQGEDIHEEVRESDAATHENKPTDESSDANENTIDYKLLYEESQKKLQTIQKQNTNQNIKDDTKESDTEILSDIVRSFM